LRQSKMVQASQAHSFERGLQAINLLFKPRFLQQQAFFGMIMEV